MCHQLPIAALLMVGACDLHSHPRMLTGSGRSCAANHSCCGFMSAVVLTLLCKEDTWVIWWQTLTFFLPSLLWWSRRLWLHLCTQHSLDTCSLHFGQLCVSVLTTFHCAERLLQWGLRAKPIYEYRDIFSGSSLVLCPFSRIIVVGLSDDWWEGKERS